MKKIKFSDIPQYRPSLDEPVSEWGPKPPEKVSYYTDVITSLQNDKDIKELDLLSQGVVTMDRFIGSVVRHYPLNGQEGAVSALQTIRAMDNLPYGLVKPGSIPKEEGLDDAIQALWSDRRTRPFFGHLEDNIRVLSELEGEEMLTLTSVAQLEGYITSAAHESHSAFRNHPDRQIGSDWMTILLYDIQQLTKDEPDPAYSSILSGQDRLTAYTDAEHFGIDLELIWRSIDEINARRAAGVDKGSARSVSMLHKNELKAYDRRLRRSMYASTYVIPNIVKIDKA